VDPPQRPADVAGLKGEVRVHEPTRAQRTIARRSAEARATVPDLELVAEVDMGACLARRDAAGYSMTAIFVRACAQSLRQVPRANGAYRDGRLELYSRVNIGLVVHRPDDYATPTIFDADTKSLAELSAECAELVQLARAGRLTAAQLAGATFTLSDMSGSGPIRWSPPPNPPQAAAITCGAIRAAALVRAGSVIAGHAMLMTLVCDHRILYGDTAARFMERIVELLEGPSQ
jgi:pyruvate dehydrogenase E2 component (dihydrolipoamide acetyltransferase)